MSAETVAPERIVIEDPWGPLDRRAEALRIESRRSLDSRRLRALLLDGLVLTPVSLACLVLVDRPWHVFLALAFALSYFFLCEALTGQTVGKRAAGLRVVRLDGRPLTVASASARNVLLPIDALGLYLVGFLTMVLSGRRQRLGDLIAGTVVTRADEYPHVPAFERHRTALLAGYPLAWIGAAVIAVTMLGREDAKAHYVADVQKVCATATASLATIPPGSDGVRTAGLTLANVRRVLATMSPPGSLAAAHARLLAAQDREAALLLDVSRVLRAPHTHADAEAALARFSSERAADLPGLRGTGLEACV